MYLPRKCTVILHLLPALIFYLIFCYIRYPYREAFFKKTGKLRTNVKITYRNLTNGYPRALGHLWRQSALYKVRWHWELSHIYSGDTQNQVSARSSSFLQLSLSNCCLFWQPHVLFLLKKKKAMKPKCFSAILLPILASTSEYLYKIFIFM